MHPPQYQSGAATTASRLGLPDLGFAGLTDFVTNGSMIASIDPTVPLIADADTGFGGANVSTSTSTSTDTVLRRRAGPEDPSCLGHRTDDQALRPRGHRWTPHRGPDPDQAMRSSGRQSAGSYGDV